MNEDGDNYAEKMWFLLEGLRHLAYQTIQLAIKHLHQAPFADLCNAINTELRA